MDNRTPPDELLAMTITTERSREDLISVYDCLREYPQENPLLCAFDDLDVVREQLCVLHGTDNAIDYLVFNEKHPNAGQEAFFDVAGYIVSFNLPGSSLSQRFIHRPHTLKQRVMIAGDCCPDFSSGLEGLASLTAFLNQYATDGVARPPRDRTAFGIDALEAQTNLFNHKHPNMEYEERPFPTDMDPEGKLMAEVRRKSFCYTTDNVVEYAESSSATTETKTGNFLAEQYAIAPGSFRHGQLVKMAVTVRSFRKNPDARFPAFTRGIEVGLRALTLLNRDAETSLVKLRHEDERQRAAELASAVKATRKPRRRIERRLETKDDYVRGKLGSMTVDDYVVDGRS